MHTRYNVYRLWAYTLFQRSDVMTFKKMLARFITLAFLISSVQISSFAASDGRVDKVLTVGESEILQGDETPKLLIHLEDALKEGDIFYLELEGASWQKSVSAKVLGNEEVTLEVTPIDESELQVAVKKESVLENQTIEIQLAVQLTDNEARVYIDGNNTSIESETFSFAKAMPYTGEVKGSTVETVTSNGTMAKLVINEPFSGAFSKAVAQGKSQVVTICLDTNDYAFDLSDEKWALRGIKGFEGLNGTKIRLVDAQTLEVTLPDTKDYKNKGAFELSGIQLISQSQEGLPESVGVRVSGDLIKETSLEVLKVSDYQMTLKSEIQSIDSGRQQKISFELEEVVANSLIKQRPTVFTVTNGAYLKANEEGKVKVWLNSQEVWAKGISEDEKVVGFEIATLPDEKVDIFEVEVCVPLDCTGTVEVLATGRSLVEDLRTSVLEVKAPFNIAIEPFEVQVGIKDQVGGAIEISETNPGHIMQDETIVIDFEESYIDLTEVPTIEVVSGDLRVGKAEFKDHSLVIPVIRKSHEASTLRIVDFKVTAGQNTAYGTYQVTVGGGALSCLGQGETKDSAQKADFIKAVGHQTAITPIQEEGMKEQMTEGQEAALASESQTSNAQEKGGTFNFIVDEKGYTLDGKSYALSVAPYEKEGQFMMPTEGVLALLGLDEEGYKWEGATKTVTFKSQPEVGFTIGEKTMRVGERTISLEVAPELTHGKTYIPMNALCEALGMSYHDEKSCLTIYTI